MTEDYYKTYYENNKERLKKQNLAYYQANREAILEKRRQKDAENPEASKTYWKEYYQKNKHRLRLKRELAKDEAAVDGK